MTAVNIEFLIIHMLYWSFIEKKYKFNSNNNTCHQLHSIFVNASPDVKTFKSNIIKLNNEYRSPVPSVVVFPWCVSCYASYSPSVPLALHVLYVSLMHDVSLPVCLHAV